MNTRLTVETHGPALIEITDQLVDWLGQIGAAEGVLTLMIRHTSASLLIQENADPQVQRDFLNWLDRTVPPATHPDMAYLRHTAEGPDDMPAHLKASLLPVSLQIPVTAGRMDLGTWQGVYLVEHRHAPHVRTISVQFLAAR